MSRRSSNPTLPVPLDQPHGTRRVGGSRQEANERVRLERPGFETTGWTLNVSRGGARLVLEEAVAPGQDFSLVMGEASPRTVRIVWTQDEADGQIVGVQFLDQEGSIPGPSDSP